MKKEKRLRAKEIYLEKLGDIPVTQIARKLGVHRVTVAKWKEDDSWDEKLTEARHLADKKVTEKIASRLAKEIDPRYENVFKAMDGLNKISFSKLFKRGPGGAFLRDEEGRFLPNEDLSPTEIRQLMAANEIYLKSIRLVQGSSTENQAVNQTVNGHVEHEVKGLGAFDKLLIDILQTGSMESQEKLMKIAVAFQEERETDG
jgi:hypothetical protein